MIKVRILNPDFNHKFEEQLYFMMELYNEKVQILLQQNFTTLEQRLYWQVYLVYELRWINS